MAWTACPICTHKNPPGSDRCGACGADFGDPDVRAMAGLPADDGAAPAAAGALGAARLFGLSLDGLVDGHALRRLAAIGTGLLALAFLLPLPVTASHNQFAWQLGGSGPRFALLVPALAVLAGLVVAVGRGLMPRAAAVVVTVFGAAVLLTMPALGAYGYGPSAAPLLFTIGAALGGAAVIARLARPTTMETRYLLCAAALVTVAGALVPVANAELLVPVEVRSLLVDGAVGRLSPLALWGRLGMNPLVLVDVVWALAPLLLVPLAALLAWPRPDGPWDRASLPLRAIAWCLVLAPALAGLAYAFNSFGWSEQGHAFIDGEVVWIRDLAGAMNLGRLRQVLLGAGASMWTTFGLAALYLGARPAPAGPATDGDGPSAPTV